MRLGLIINPIAGMGGKVGLKGTDGQATLERAKNLGAEATASARAARALNRLVDLRGQIDLIAGAGVLGAELAEACGWEPTVIGRTGPEPTSAADTIALARSMAEQVDLLLFAGGDGTARDIHGVVGSRIPMLGIPAGVKMHSAVFATSPENAGAVATAYLSSYPGNASLHEAEVMDVDEEALREDRVAPRLYGYARVPAERGLVQGAKTRPIDQGDGALDALAAEIVEEMEDDSLYIIGPGRSTKRILDRLGIQGTLLGVDAVRNRRLVGRDLAERDLIMAIGDGPATIITGVIGGQGYIFGRGNQQISAAIIRRIGPDRIIIIADLTKLVALDPGCLRVDSGDVAVDRMLCGYRRVRVAPGRTVMLEVIA